MIHGSKHPGRLIRGAVLLLAAVLAACDGGGTGGTATTSQDPVHASVTPTDTALYVGASYNIRIRYTDPNARIPQNVRIVTSPNLSVGTGGIRADAVGRGWVTLAAPVVADTVWVSVVPRGTIVSGSVALNSRDSARIRVFNLDGSEMRQIATVAFQPRWSPDGGSIVYTQLDWGKEEVHQVSASGGQPRALLAGRIPGWEDESDPQYSPDGAWIYFLAGNDDKENKPALWRARPDGTGVGRLSAPGVLFGAYSLAPDGTRLVHVTGSSRLSVFDVATLTSAPTNIPAAVSHWSGAKNLIAYISDGRLHTILPDGSGDRALTNADRTYQRGLSWSPDGEWLIAHAAVYSTGGMLLLVRVSDGLTLPLPFTGNFIQPSWRPE
jgi:Tol biopolymer transport system component